MPRGTSTRGNPVMPEEKRQKLDEPASLNILQKKSATPKKMPPVVDKTEVDKPAAAKTLDMREDSDSEEE